MFDWIASCCETGTIKNPLECSNAIRIASTNRNEAKLCLQVTWTRRRDKGDLQLLSVGDYTYINDNRFIISNKKVDNVSIHFPSCHSQSLMILSFPRLQCDLVLISLDADEL